MFVLLYISTIVVSSVLVGVGVISSRRNGVKARRDSTGHASGDSSTVRHFPGQTLTERQPSFDEMMCHLKNISPFGKDSEQTLHYQRQYIDLWNRCLEKNLAEISEGDRQGIELYCYEVDAGDQVCRGHLLQGTFVSRSNIHAFPEIVPPFHLGCSCRLRRLLFMPSCAPGTSFRHLSVADKLPVLPGWRERSELNCARMSGHTENLITSRG